MVREGLPKRKFVILIGYNGENYHGLQVNPGVKTIESELFAAFCKAGFVSDRNSEDPSKIGWMRSCRTDKGVHAGAQVLSAKLQCEGEKEEIEKINSLLPADIRLFDLFRSVGGFHSQRECSGRIYEYNIPSFVFAKIDESITRDMEYVKSYRIPEDTKKELEEFLSLYIGTRNYHNYTIKQNYSQDSSKRYITLFGIKEVKEYNGIEWISIRVGGQSFMMNQIRKMIGFCILVFSHGSQQKERVFKESVSDKKVSVPKAPACGLLLIEPEYKIYNIKLASRDDLQEISFDRYSTEIEEFKSEKIYPSIHREENITHFLDLLEKLLEYREDYKYVLNE